jgi:hypothetical protein
MDGGVQGVLSGVNATVFAYGATGSGKTYTMVGADQDPGLMVLSLRDIFDVMQQAPHAEQTVTCSYLEVYNEIIYDLLHPQVSVGCVVPSGSSATARLHCMNPMLPTVTKRVASVARHGGTRGGVRESVVVLWDAGRGSRERLGSRVMTQCRVQPVDQRPHGKQQLGVGRCAEREGLSRCCWCCPVVDRPPTS